MTERTRTIHIQIGADSVFENALERIAGTALLEQSPRRVTFVPDAMYKKHFRRIVDSGQVFVGNEGFDEFSMNADTLILSRPRFLFLGLPMNTEAGAAKALYKLDTIQSAFSDFKVIFHFFLVDHLTYLFGPKKRDISLIPNSYVSWLPIINGVTNRLQEGNELVLQEAEDPKNLYVGLLEEVLGFSGLEAEDSCINHGLADQSLISSEILEARATKAGWNVEHLDDCYAEDLVKADRVARI